MHPAVTKLAVMDLTLLGSLPCYFLNSFELLPFPLATLNFLLLCIGRLGMLVQIIIQFFLQEITDKGPDCLAFR